MNCSGSTNTVAAQTPTKRKERTRRHVRTYKNDAVILTEAMTPDERKAFDELFDAEQWLRVQMFGDDPADAYEKAVRSVSSLLVRSLERQTQTRINWGL